MIKKILFLIIFFIFFISISNAEVAYIPYNTHEGNLFISGIKKIIPDISIFNSENINDNIKIILTMSLKDYLNIKVTNKKIFAAFLDDYVKGLNNTKNLIGEFIPDFPYYQIIMKIKEHYPHINSIGIVLHNERLIKKIAGLRIYSPLIKIYEVTNRQELFYKFNQAVRNNDFILLVPDNFIFNYFSIQKILKILNNNDIIYGGYSKAFLKYGASMGFEIDYYKEGVKVGHFLKNYKCMDEKKIKIFYPDKIEYFFND